MKKKKFLAFLQTPWFILVFSGVLAILCLSLTHLSMPKPALMALTLDLVHHQKVPCFDLGYVVYSALFFGMGGNLGLLIGQAIVYILIGIVSYFILGKCIGGKSYLPTIGACLILIYPPVWLNIHRIVDTNMAIALILVFIYFLLPKCLSQTSPTKAALFGVICAYMILTRSNLVFVLPLGVIPMLKSIKNAMVITVTGLIVLILISNITTNSFYPKPREGVYSFFTGANSHTKETLLKYLTTEPVSPEVFREAQIDQTKFPNDAVLVQDEQAKSKMLQYSLNWIENHPLDYLGLIPIKFWTLMRPDFRGAERHVGWKAIAVGLVQLSMALIFPFWLIAKFIVKDRFYGPLGVAPLAILYAIPMLLTVADPRHRQLLDVLFLLEIIVFCFVLGNPRNRIQAGQN
jgi:hypothetical protein